MTFNNINGLKINDKKIKRKIKKGKAGEQPKGGGFVFK